MFATTATGQKRAVVLTREEVKAFLAQLTGEE